MSVRNFGVGLFSILFLILSSDAMAVLGEAPAAATSSTAQSDHPSSHPEDSVEFEELVEVHFGQEKTKFSAAHTTVFPDGKKESFHGHNFQVKVSLTLRKSKKFEDMIDFAIFKSIISDLVKAWDEKILLQGTCPHLKITEQNKESIDLTICNKRYVFPIDEVVILNLNNIACEDLSGEFLRNFVAKLKIKMGAKMSDIKQVKVTIDESPGQGATSTWNSHL